jgi:hypothetical protein
LKDTWKLLEESLIGNKDAYLELIDDIVPAVLRYFLTIYDGNSPIAVAQSIQVFEQSFINLKNWTQKEIFIKWLLTDLISVKNDNLSNRFKENTELLNFTNIYVYEIVNFRYAFDPLLHQEFSLDQKTKFSELVPLISSSEKIKLQPNVDQIKSSLNLLNQNWKYAFVKNQFILVLAVVLIVVGYGIYFLVDNNYPIKKEIDKSKLVSIHAPMEVIFEDFYDRMRSQANIDDEMDEPEPIATVENKQSTEANTKEEVVQAVKVETEVAKVESIPAIKVEEKPIVKEEEVVKKEPVIKVEIKDEKTVPVKNETVADPVKVTKTIAEIEPIIEDEPEEKEQEIVVLGKQQIPLLPKNETNPIENSITLGRPDEEQKHALKDFKDQKVVFFSFLEVKDVEKAKEAAFKILTKFGYKGEVLKTEKSYMIITATFPGKQNHDKMIRKFNGLGTLYMGNDVSEFLELYKFDLDKKRSQFFPKYKPEDLPKEVTVNLYIFPKEKKN